MIIDEILIGNDENSKRAAIMAHLDRDAILKDSHANWCHGHLELEGYDKQVYKINIPDGRGKRTLDYHDLEQLLITRDNVYNVKK